MCVTILYLDCKIVKVFSNESSYQRRRRKNGDDEKNKKKTDYIGSVYCNCSAIQYNTLQSYSNEDQSVVFSLKPKQKLFVEVYTIHVPKTIILLLCRAGVSCVCNMFLSRIKISVYNHTTQCIEITLRTFVIFE